jgi:hypothetical protein
MWAPFGKKKNSLNKLMDDIMISCPTLERTMKAWRIFLPRDLFFFVSEKLFFFAHNNIMAWHSLAHPPTHSHLRTWTWKRIELHGHPFDHAITATIWLDNLHSLRSPPTPLLFFFLFFFPLELHIMWRHWIFIKKISKIYGKRVGGWCPLSFVESIILVDFIANNLHVWNN